MAPRITTDRILNNMDLMLLKLIQSIDSRPLIASCKTYFNLKRGLLTTDKPNSIFSQGRPLLMSQLQQRLHTKKVRAVRKSNSGDEVLKNLNPLTVHLLRISPQNLDGLCEYSSLNSKPF